MSAQPLQDLMEAPIDGQLRARLDALFARQAEIEKAMLATDAQKDRARFQEVLKEHGANAERVQLYADYRKTEQELGEAQSMAATADGELAELARSELASLEQKRAELARKLREGLLDSEVEGADSNAIVEIRAGTGGDEAALFAADMFRMYTLYAESRGWKIDVLEQSRTELGGYREVVFDVEGRGAFRTLRFESGGHRVQRVPETETQGRIHTSAVTVAVMQEVPETEVQINDKDLRVDTFCASGPGGQKVNKTASAVRITHIPTGVVVSIQDEKSQHKNRAKAMKVLATRLRDREQQERRQKEDALRRSLIGSGDRSDRIRTYNFSQNRVTDHRINVSLYALDRYMSGDIQPMLDQILSRDREERVQALGTPPAAGALGTPPAAGAL